MVLWVLLLCLVAPSTATVVIFAQPGGSVTLPRVQWGDTDKVYVNWYFVSEVTTLLISRNPQQPTPKKETWENRISLSPDFSLIISSVQDFGVFICEQHELTSTNKREYTLYRITMPSTMTLVAGDDLSLSCDLEEDGYKLAYTKVECFKPDGKKHLPTISKGNRNTMSLQSVSSSHSGSWWCSVQYNVLSKTHVSNASTALTVIDLAPSSPDPVYTSVSVSDFTVPCAMSPSVPWSILNHTGLRDGSWSFTPLNSTTTRTVLTLKVNPTPEWRAQEGPDPFLKGRELNNHDLSVQIPKVSVHHRGTYTCSLRIKSRPLSRKTTVEVLQINSSARGPTQEGGTVNLTCSLGHSLSPGLQVVWTPPRSSLSSQMGPETLLLSTVTLQHAGSWTCTLKKDRTFLTKATVKLEIVKAPVDIWLVVSITCGVLVFVLFLVITVIIVYRHRQVTKRRRRRTRFCCCEKPQPKGFYKS